VSEGDGGKSLKSLVSEFFPKTGREIAKYEFPAYSGETSRTQLFRLLE